MIILENDFFKMLLLALGINLHYDLSSTAYCLLSGEINLISVIQR